jgi:putative tryptophan/tyrosine transport system substrate-binding protein
MSHAGRYWGVLVLARHSLVFCRGRQMRRREFITLLGGSVAWPLVAGAQQNGEQIRLGLVPVGSPENTYDLSLVEAFRQGLRKVGLIENQNVILDVAWVKDDPDQAVSDVLRRGAQVLIPCGSSASAAAQRQTSTIPIVFLNVGDPIAIGLVELGASGSECDRIQ